MSSTYEELKKRCKSVVDANLQTTNPLNIKMFTKDYASFFRREKELKFYKYYKPTYHAIRNLETDMLMCNNPKDFNDIYEGMVTSIDCKSGNVRSIISDVCDAVSISCFSETWDNLLMYAHYTDSFKGFCVEYNFDYIKNNISWLYFFPVIYQKKPSSLAQMEKLKEDIDSVSNAMKNNKIVLTKLDDIISYFIHKADIWSYENEWRFIIPVTQYWNFFGNKNIKDKRHYIQNFDCVSAVYLAANIETLHREHICEIINRKNEVRKKSNSDKKPIAVYKTMIDESKYTLVSERI